MLYWFVSGAHEGPGLLGGGVGYHGDQETQGGDSCTNVRHNMQKDGTRGKYIARVEVLKYTKHLIPRNKTNSTAATYKEETKLSQLCTLTACRHTII